MSFLNRFSYVFCLRTFFCRLFFCVFTFGAFSSLCSAQGLAPNITEPPEEFYETVEDGSVTLRCRVFGTPPPHVQWLRSGKELTGGHYVLQPNGDLQIVRTLFTDAGRYKCIAKNSLGQVESDDAMGQLEVREKTRITAEENYHQVTVGKSVTLRCSVEWNDNLSLVVVWQVNGQDIYVEGDPRMFIWAETVLTISNIKESDSGVYACVARTRLDNATAETTLVVQNIPNAPLIVSVECNKKTAVVKWQANKDCNAPILFYSIQYNTSYNPDEWKIVNDCIPATKHVYEVPLKPWTDFTFGVTAHNKIGSSARSNHSSVCQTPPDISSINGENVTVHGTSPNNVVITWRRMSPDEHNGPGFFYRVFWKRVDIEMEWQIEDVVDWQQNELIICDQPTFVPYIVKVETHNDLGPAAVEAKEVFGYSGESKPLFSPQNLRLLRVVDSNTAEIAWDPVPPESVGGHLKGYKIRIYNNKNNSESYKESVINGNVSNETLDVLTPFSENFVRVLVFNCHYDGPPSDVIKITTPEGKPESVFSFNAYPMGSTSLWLTWSKPNHINGILKTYHIICEKVDEEKSQPMIKPQPLISDSNSTSAKLVGLDPNTLYMIAISASTGAGFGASHSIEVWTESANGLTLPPDKPSFSWTRLESTDGLTSIRVTWIPNVTGNPGTHFYVQYRHKGKTDWQMTKVVWNDVKVEVTELLPGSYEIMLVAVNGRYKDSSDVLEIQTGKTVLSKIPKRKTVWMALYPLNLIGRRRKINIRKSTIFRTVGAF